MRRQRTALILAVLAAAAPARAQTVAIEGARVWAGPGNVVDGATVVIRNGVIAEVGAGVAVPAGAVRIDGKGTVVLALGPSGSPIRAAVAGFGCIESQAIVFDQSFQKAAMTNLNTMHFDLNGSTPFSVNAGSPLTIPLGSRKRIYVQNDGNGAVTVECLRSGIPLLSFNVIERTRGGTGGLLGIPAGTTDIRISTLNANTNFPTRGTYLFY